MWQDVYGVYSEDIKKEHYGEEKYKIIRILEKISNNPKHNKKLVTKNFDINYKNEYGQSLLHLFVDELYDEEKVLLSIETLLDLGLNPNLEDNQKYNFIQTALYTGYSEDFILKIINLSKCSEHYVFDPNHIDDDGDTMVHSAIYSEEYKGNLFAIYDSLLRNGFDNKIKNNKGRDILDALTIKDEDTPDKNIPDKGYMIELIECMNEEKNHDVEKYKYYKTKYKSLKQEDCVWLNQYGTFNKFNIDLEHNWINCAEEKVFNKNIKLICGKDGVGKTTYLKTLMNTLSNKGRSVYITSYDQILLNCNSIGNFYNTLYKIMSKCAKNDLILLFDDFDKIYIKNTDDEDKEIIDNFIEFYTWNKNLDLIATIDINNKEFIECGILNWRLDFKYIIEPDNSIINKYVNDELSKLNITIDSNLDTILKELIVYITNTDNLEDEYKNISNIKIVSKLINDIIEFNKSSIDIDNIIYGINMCYFLKLESKKYILGELNNYKKINKPLVRKREKQRN